MRSLALALTLCMAVPAVAQMRTAPNRATAPFWREIREPGYTRAEELVAQARALIARALSRGSGEWAAVCRVFPSVQVRRTLRHETIERSILFENAIARLEQARALAPNDPRVAFLLAYAVESWQRPEMDCTVTRRDRDALQLYEMVRGLDPNYRAEDVAFELAILHSRLEEPREAASEYQRRLALSLSEDETSSVHGNLGEVLMLSGHLTEAVFHYEEAVRIAEARPNATAELTLGLWGLAVALDRLGEFTSSQTNARRAMSLDSGSMAALRGRGVFFVPAYELHYIEAVGQLARVGGTDRPIAAVPSTRTASESLFDSLDATFAQPMLEAELRAISHAVSEWLLDTDAAERERDDNALRSMIRMRTRPASGAPRTASDSQRRAACQIAAARSFTRYLAEGGEGGAWARNAHNHLTRIAGDLEALSRRR